MSLIVTILIVVSLFVPGSALLHLRARNWSAEKKIIFAPAVTIVAYGLAGLLGWVFPHLFGLISWTCILGLTIIGLAVLIRTKGMSLFKECDPVLLIGYTCLTLFATQSALLHYAIPTEFPTDNDRATYYVTANILPVRIQAMHHNLPNDNLLPYHFADLILRGVDLRQTREIGCDDAPALAPGQHITSRTPLMALVGANYIKIFRRNIPVDHRVSKMDEIYTDKDYFPMFVAGTCMNALFILPAYLIGLNFGGRRTARMTLLVLALNYGIILHSNFIWPKALAGYFGLLAAYLVVEKSKSILGLGALASLSYYSHPCGAGLVAGVFLFKFVTEYRDLRSVRQLVAAASVACVLLLPWHLWAMLSMGDSGNLISQNMSQNADKGWDYMVAIRVANAMRTVIPHFWGQDKVLTGPLLWCQCVFTLPGMLGLVLVPFFIAALSSKRNAIIAATMGLTPLAITAVCLGGFAGGLAPFGPFLFIPIAACMAASVLAQMSAGLRVGILIAVFAEQAVTLEFVIYSHWEEFLTVSGGKWGRPALLVALQTLLIATAIWSACRRERRIDGAVEAHEPSLSNSRLAA